MSIRSCVTWTGSSTSRTVVRWPVRRNRSSPVLRSAACTARRSRCCAPAISVWSWSVGRTRRSAGCIMADGPTWNVVADIRQLWSFPFMVNAFRAGTIIAVASAVMGWFMVLRRQTFAGHTLALVGFPGAAGATLIGVSATYGYFAFCVGAALVIAAIPRAGEGSYGHESAVTGTVQAFALACGFLFIALYKGFLNGVNALLFGTFLGITNGEVVGLLVVTVVVLVVLAVMGRPLLFVSVDPVVAEARGIPVR